MTNRLALPLVPHLPGFGVIEHTGRKTGRRYRTPVLAFRRRSDYVVALTYGPGTDWAQNVLAQGGCLLVRKGREIRLSQPRIVHAETGRPVPPVIAFVLSLAGVSDFLLLRP